MNRMKSIMLLAGLTALLVWVGNALGGQSGMAFALIVAGLMNMGAYWYSDKIVLRMHHARPATESEAPVLYEVVRDLALRAQMPMPKVYILSEDTPNAFATGRNPENAAVAVTVGLMEMLDKNELRGVLAHELSHVQNRDTLVMSIAATLAGALTMLSRFAMWGSMGGRDSDGEARNPLAGLIGVILAPIAAMLIQMAISRSREYFADESGAHLAQDPISLARALVKIESWSKKIPLQTAAPSSAHMFIINPLIGSSIAHLFSTHPQTKDRVRRLEQMAQSASYHTMPA
jgi:heat shock protein HtpX